MSKELTKEAVARALRDLKQRVTALEAASKGDPLKPDPAPKKKGGGWFDDDDDDDDGGDD